VRLDDRRRRRAKRALPQFHFAAAGWKDGGQADGCTDSRSSLALIHRGPQRAATAGEDREVRA